MSSCGCEATPAQTEAQRRTLLLALALNATMFVVGMIAGLIAQSSGLVADSLDMLADASAYAIALMAIGRGDMFKARAAGLSGGILLLLGLGVLADVARRGVFGSTPDSVIMMVVATVALIVNATVLRLLGRMRGEGVHLNATWIFTKVDVIANIAVILSGFVVWLSGYRLVDLVVGAAIGVYVIKEAAEILESAREARSRASGATVSRDGD
ncbi:MAG: cation transporter [Proteobacteria bacterium]|nr:cation transporter [Pseudomonadota bacterium]